MFHPLTEPALHYSLYLQAKGSAHSSPPFTPCLRKTKSSQASENSEVCLEFPSLLPRIYIDLDETLLTPRFAHRDEKVRERPSVLRGKTRSWRTLSIIRTILVPDPNSPEPNPGASLLHVDPHLPTFTIAPITARSKLVDTTELLKHRCMCMR